VLITKEIEVNVSNNYSYYEKLGYVIPKIKNKQNKMIVKRNTIILIKTEDLPNKSNIKIEVKCDGENCKNPYLKPIIWQDYKKGIKEDGKYYCKKCSRKLYGEKKYKETRLKNGKSFEHWCIENNYLDILDRWDYKLNKDKPNIINYCTHENFYFKCPKILHQSELKKIKLLTNNNQKGSMDCKACNSFAQWGIDNISEDFLEKYWDYEKNIGINPWKISKGSHKPKIWIRCQVKDYHGSYSISCFNFINDTRCSYCGTHKIHLLDSLGVLFPKSIIAWSDKNKRSSYEYAPYSSQSVWWKCLENNHKDYQRKIVNSTICDFRCPECQYSKGEKIINEYFINIKINFIPQKEFEGLIGLGGGLLSYDFYLPNYNLLIEFQGEQHEKYIKGFHKSKKDFEKQVEHDRRKKEYAVNHNIKLLEIWYWDFDKIEEILENELYNI